MDFSFFLYLDHDVHYNWSDMLTGLNLGYSISGQGGSTQYFLGAARDLCTCSQVAVLEMYRCSTSQVLLTQTGFYQK